MIDDAVSLPGIYTRDEIIVYIAEGNRVKYLFFWRHTPKETSGIGRECLSQWYEASFEVDGILYSTAEHYMMAEFNGYTQKGFH